MWGGEEIAVRLDLPGNDEFSRTATTMNNMLDRVHETQEKLRYLSLQDGLTGLYNRNFFDHEINQIDSYNLQSIGVVSCDMDGLKFVNDTLGHSVGDDMLVQISKILTNVYKNKGKVIRMGGDEFVILLTNVDEEYIQSSCQRINHSLEIVNLWRNGFKLQVSIGWEYTDVQPINGNTIIAMIEKADDAMYRHKLARSFEKRRIMMKEILKMLESRYRSNEGHSERVADLSVALGKTVGLGEENLRKIRSLSKFHNLGMIGISDWIIFKQETLTAQEKIEMERHVEIGYRIAQSIPELMDISDLILKHHEWWNGQGYPIGLEGGDIPVEDRIFAIVHAYDEMMNDLPDSGEMAEKDAVEKLQQLKGIQFDPQLVDLFAKVILK